MRIIEALATELPVIITDTQEKGLQTTTSQTKVPEIVEQTGTGGAWLTALIIFFAVICLSIVTVLIIYMVKRKSGQCTIRDKKDNRRETSHKVLNKESVLESPILQGTESKAEEQITCKQMTVPDRNSQVYPEILLVNLDQPDIVFQTRISEHIVIGRREDSDIRIHADTAVSSRHCMISMKGTQFYLEDCNSTNGTRYNDWEVTTKIPILSGGILEIGHSKYRLVIRC